MRKLHCISEKHGTSLVLDDSICASGLASCMVGGTLLVWGGERYGFEPGFYRSCKYINMLCLDLIDHRSPLWITIDCDQGDIPALTSGASMVFAQGHIIVFGGYVWGQDEAYRFVEAKRVNRTYKLNLATRRWKRVEYAEEDPRPTPRDKCCSWEYQNRAFFFSGYGAAPSHPAEFADGQFLVDLREEDVWNNQLLEFNVKTEKWSHLPTYGSIPSPRAAAAACIVRDQVFVFGGRTQTRRRNDLYKLDMNSLVWTKIEMAKSQVEDIIGRSWCTLSVTDDMSRCYIWGGQLDGMDERIITAQMVEGDLVEGKWIATASATHERHWHVATLRNGVYSVVCGAGNDDDRQVSAYDYALVQPASLNSLAFNKVTLKNTRRLQLPADLEKRLYLRALVRGCPAHKEMFQDASPLDLIHLASLY